MLRERQRFRQLTWTKRMLPLRVKHFRKRKETKNTFSHLACTSRAKTTAPFRRSAPCLSSLFYYAHTRGLIATIYRDRFDKLGCWHLPQYHPFRFGRSSSGCKANGSHPREVLDLVTSRQLWSLQELVEEKERRKVLIPSRIRPASFHQPKVSRHVQASGD